MSWPPYASKEEFMRATKDCAAWSASGAAVDYSVNPRYVYLCMGCVKLDDNEITWDAEAMAQGKPLRKR
jgi:hypothetical protein